jgi:hypothetical protein
VNEKRWVIAVNGTQVIAVQHGCGIGDAPVNCYRDEHDNWVCPNCMDTYGAAIPLAEWDGPPLKETAPGGAAE